MSDPNDLKDYEQDFQFEESDFDQQEEEPEQQAEEQQEEVGEQEVETVTQEVPTTNQQTSEQNAYYAEQRRQNLVEQRVQQELQRLRQEAPEFQMATMLSEMYGMPVDQLYGQLQEMKLQKQAEERGVPIEVLRQINAYEQQQMQLQEQLHSLQFQSWQNRVTAEANQLVTQYPMLTSDDIEQAKFYLLETLRNPEIPLQNAVFALHGDKIANNLKNLAKQEALAEISGRKKGGLPPQSMKVQDDSALSEEERYIARNMGLSESEYLRWKK